MKKIKEEIDLTENKPKKGLFQKVFNGKAEQKEILKYIKSNNVKNLLFYTDVNNLLFILDKGILLTKDLKKLNEDFVAWTHLENDNSIGLEFDNSTRAHFWKWASNNDIDISQISVIGVNPIKMAETSKEDWAFDKLKNITYVYENIDKKAIDWIMIKDKKNLKRISTIIESNNLPIQVFLGEKGNVQELDKE